MKKLFLLPLLLLMGFCFQACNNSEDSVDKANEANEKKDSLNTNGAASNMVEEMDSKFLVEAADGGMTEIESGNLAQQKASNARVKAFAAMMVADHTKAGAEVKTLASLKNVTLPSAVSDEHQKHLNELKEKSGADFDKAYMSMMVDDHEKTVNKFEKAANDAKDADVKSLANKTLPTLRMHLDSAKAINDAVKNKK